MKSGEGVAVKAGSTAAQFQVDRALCEGQNTRLVDGIKLPQFPIVVWIVSVVPHGLCSGCGGPCWTVFEQESRRLHKDLNNDIKIHRRRVCAGMGKIIE